MSQIKIQEYIITEVKVNHCAAFKRGQTLKARDEASKARWTKFLIAHGYSATDAEIIYGDAYDMAILELAAV